MDIQEIKFKLREKISVLRIASFYFIQEPYYEAKRIWKGSYDSTLFFWFTVVVYTYLWKNGVGGYTLKFAGIAIFFAYFYMFFKSGRWKEYYYKEFVEGKKIE